MLCLGTEAGNATVRDRRSDGDIQVVARRALLDGDLTGQVGLAVAGGVGDGGLVLAAGIADADRGHAEILLIRERHPDHADGVGRLLHPSRQSVLAGDLPVPGRALVGEGDELVGRRLGYGRQDRRQIRSSRCRRATPQARQADGGRRDRDGREEQDEQDRT